jgi:hypothetical protein
MEVEHLRPCRSITYSCRQHLLRGRDQTLVRGQVIFIGVGREIRSMRSGWEPGRAPREGNPASNQNLPERHSRQDGKGNPATNSPLLWPDRVEPACSVVICLPGSALSYCVPIIRLWGVRADETLSLSQGVWWNEDLGDRSWTVPVKEGRRRLSLVVDVLLAGGGKCESACSRCIVLGCRSSRSEICMVARHTARVTAAT